MELEPGRNKARIVIVEARECVEIDLTQNQKALIDVGDWERVRHFRWYAVRARESFYAVRSVVVPGRGNRQVFLHREILGEILGEPDADTGDHVDRTKTLDNRRENLRSATEQENDWNRGAHVMKAGRTTPYKGVFLDRTHGRYKASVQHDGKRISLGYFDDAEDAAVAYDKKVRELRGDWAVTNFVYTRAVPIWP